MDWNAGFGQAGLGGGGIPSLIDTDFIRLRVSEEAVNWHLQIETMAIEVEHWTVVLHPQAVGSDFLCNT